MKNAMGNASLFSCQRTLRPKPPDRSAPGGTFTPFLKRQNKKNPASSAGLNRPQTYGRVRAKLDSCLTCIRNRPHFREVFLESPIAPDNLWGCLKLLVSTLQLFARRIESIPESFDSSSGRFQKCEKTVNILCAASILRRLGNAGRKPNYADPLPTSSFS
jgi:hypothetical protein